MPWPAVWTASWRTSGPPGSRPWPGGADGEVELDIEVAGSIAPAANIADGARSAFEAALRIGRRSGSNWHLAGAILGLACLAGDAGDWEWAATLAQALGTGPAKPWQEDEARVRRDGLDQARADLGDEQLERAYAHGMALSREKAFDLIVPKAARA